MTGTALVPTKDYSIVKRGQQGIDLLRETLDGQDVNEFSLPRVRIPAGGGLQWEVPTLSGSEATKELQGVVVMYKSSRSYWSEPYEGDNEPPDCSASDAKHAVKGDNEIEIPATLDEATNRLLCETCAFSEWGSSDTGSGRGQACKLTRQLFLIVPDRMLPLVVTLPPTSLKAASAYFLMLADYSKDYRRITTVVGLEKRSGKSVPDFSAATFRMGEDLDDETAEIMASYSEALRPHFEAVRVESQAEVVDAS
jgi:hypothetical protein